MKISMQGNSPTAYADLSGIYGIDNSTLDSLRERKGGRLITNEYNVLPLDPNSPPQAPYGAGERQKIRAKFVDQIRIRKCRT